jgi:hypothetical protein
MTNYLFHKIIPESTLFDLLEKICFIKTQKYYLISLDCFKKLLFLNEVYTSFLTDILPYYKKNKQFYVTCKIKYNNFLTIIRQICKSNNIKYVSKIIYHKSNYNIVYYIYKS